MQSKVPNQHKHVFVNLPTNYFSAANSSSQNIIPFGRQLVRVSLTEDLLTSKIILDKFVITFNQGQSGGSSYAITPPSPIVFMDVGSNSTTLRSPGVTIDKSVTESGVALPLYTTASASPAPPSAAGTHNHYDSYPWVLFEMAEPVLIRDLSFSFHLPNDTALGVTFGSPNVVEATSICLWLRFICDPSPITA